MGFGKDGKGVILWDVNTISTGALASADAVVAGSYGSLTTSFRILKTEYFMGANFAGVDAQEGPLLVGIASKALSAAEVEECIEATPANHSDNANEHSMRAVWPLETFFQLGDTSSAIPANVSAKGIVNLKWTFEEDGGWNWFAYNYSGVALTAGATINIVAKHFGVWV